MFDKAKNRVGGDIKLDDLVNNKYITQEQLDVYKAANPGENPDENPS